MIIPRYDLKKIKFATDEATFERAVVLYETGKVTKFEYTMNGFSAIVIGTQPYRVFVSALNYDCGSCDCYLGNQDMLCKHMVAVGIRAVTAGEPLSDDDKLQHNQIFCSDKLGTLTKIELSAVKKSITVAMRYIKSYSGPSRIWFAYQDSLREGCNYLSAIVSELPIGKETARLLVDTLLRLDNKLQGGVDDSDGTVGGFIEEVVNILKEYAKLDPACKKAFLALINKKTCFGWEESLLQIINEEEE
ncbi:MAG: hypothetical protein Q8O66_03220 [bacterium]|nr:hypothetical protein [bacterium]